MTPLFSRFFSYFGSKTSIAGSYPRPKYQTIVEPFAGSAGYACQYPSRRVILVEKDPQIVALWDWLIKVSPEEVLSLPLEVTDLREMRLTPEQTTFIGLWLRGGSTPGIYKRPPSRRPGQPGNFPGSIWSSRVRARIARQVGIIRHWKIIEGDYSLAADTVGGEATWFVDPPYQILGKAYKESSKNIDFTALGDWCKTRKGQVIVCENEGADWLPFRPFKSTPTSGRKMRKEVVWISEENWKPQTTLFSFPRPIIRVKRIGE